VFLDGERTLDRDAIRAPLAALADRLGASLEDAAEGVVAVADAAMERALRVISVERGYDPVGFAVVAFGGAGGLHVAELTARLGALRAIVPPDPGLLSAYGMLASPVTHEASRTILARNDTPNADAIIRDALDELEHDARGAMTAAGSSASTLSVERWIDARYSGQSFELAVAADGWTKSFHLTHEERYGYARPESAVEAVTVRVVVSAPPPPPAGEPLAAARGSPATTPSEVVLGGRTLRASRVRRRDLRAGHRLEGPVVVQEYSGTTWVPPEYRLEVDAWGCLHLSV